MRLGARACVPLPEVFADRVANGMSDERARHDVRSPMVVAYDHARADEQ